MEGLICLPELGEDTGVLEARVTTYLALSQIFAKGGEKLEQTLAGLVDAYSEEVDAIKDEKADLSFKRLLKELESAEADELAYEFNRLFVGPMSPEAPPYESVYSTDDRLVMQDVTLEVRRWYSKENLCTSNPVSFEPDDFIATELEFAAYLLARAHECYQQNYTARATEYLDLYNAFWQEHLGIWLPGFVQAISSSSSARVFKVIGEILLQAVIPIQQGKGGLS